jgi:Domain of unknown function (DUF5666)
MLNRLKLFVAGAALAAGLAACGGGGGGGTTGSASTSAMPAGNVTSVVQGTVTGFGSVVVDGDHLNEAGAAIDIQGLAGLANQSGLSTDVQLGQRVEVDLDPNGNALAIHIQPELIGTVSAIDATNQTITVNSVLVQTNTDATKGPVTVYAGYSKFSDIQANDRVEVHGVPSVDASGHLSVVATRIQQAPLSNAVLVTGTVSNLNAMQFTLAGLNIDATGASILPAGAALANGERVTVHSNGPAVNGTLTADSVRVRKRTASATTLKIAGVVSAYDATAGTFVVGGTKVDATAAKVTPASRVIADDEYAIVVGSYDAASSTLKADTVRIHGPSTMEKVALAGTVTDFVDPSNFKVRGVLVDASGTGVKFNGGTASTLANNVFVVIQGDVGNGVVVASMVSFLPVPMSGVLDVVGLVSSYDSGTGTLTLDLRNGKTFTAMIATDATFLPAGKTAADLVQNAYVRLHGTTTNGTYTATQVMILPTPGGGAFETVGVVGNVQPTSGTPMSFQLNDRTFNIGTGVTVPSEFANGSLVRITFTVSNGVYTVTSITLDPWHITPKTVITGPLWSGSNR